MGRIKRANGIRNGFGNALAEIGFEYGSGPQGEPDWVNTYRQDGERLWVTVDLERDMLCLYNEYNCGGLLWQDRIPIPEEALESPDDLIDWLDETIG